jgi:hypothetical protein
MERTVIIPADQPEPALGRPATDLNQLGASATLRHKLALARLGVVLGVELKQSLSRNSCMRISRRVGSGANPGGRADGNRKQR